MDSSAIVLAMAAMAVFLLGLGLGWRLRAGSAKSERALMNAEKTQMEQRAAELARDLIAAKNELAQTQAESAERAKFEALAAERERSVAELRLQLQAKTEAERQLSAQNEGLRAALRAEQEKTPENLRLLENAKKTLADQFQALAGEIFEKKSQSFSESSQKELGTLLDPLKTQIENFRKKVEEAQSDSKTGVTKLETLIGVLAEQSKQMGEKADHLTLALRGSAKAQGDWGEFILRDLLEKAGLREGEQYSFQQAFSGVPDAEGEKNKSVRTDVILRLPGERCLVIDSKVTLNSYTDYVNAGQDGVRAAALKQHLASVRGHVSDLAQAGYHRLPGIETPDFVVMFVPIEPAFLLALQHDSELWADAYRQGILLVGPTTLLYIIRIVNVLWQQEAQARNVKDVMDRGAELYDKFAGFVSDMQAIGDSLRKTDSSYTAAMKKLSEGRGNLVRQVEMLKELGVRSTKNLPRNLLDAAGTDEPSLALTPDNRVNE
jgi:DNA recombination protein RmuC